MNTSIGYGILAFFMWGLLPLFLKQMPNLDAYEITSFRIIMSAITLYLFIGLRSKFKTIGLILAESIKRPSLYLSSVLIGINWFLFVYCIEKDIILDASFGYFCGPLISVMLGVLFLNEKLNKTKVIALILVLLSVAIQGYELGEIPIISVVLALSFAFYGMVKKVTKPRPLGSLFFESLMMTPIALYYLLFLSQKSYLLNASSIEYIYILLSGIVTILPLIFFTKAANRLALNTLGLIQYISPLTQFIIGVFVYQEALKESKTISFILIWVSCMMILINQNKKGRSLK